MSELCEQGVNKISLSVCVYICMCVCVCVHVCVPECVCVPCVYVGVPMC